MIYPVTGCFKRVQYNDIQAAIIDNLVEKQWLCRYLKTKMIKYDRGHKLLGRAFKNYLVKKQYRNKPKCASAENTKEKFILERIQKVIANLVYRDKSKNNCLGKDEPW